MILKKLMPGDGASKQAEREAELYRNLIRHEARIGGQLFGEVPAGVRREFFCLDRHTWVWHEEWSDLNGARHVRTTRYDIRPDGILKAQNGHYQALQRPEALRLIEAIDLYEKRVKTELYAGVVGA